MFCGIANSSVTNRYFVDLLELLIDAWTTIDLKGLKIRNRSIIECRSKKSISMTLIVLRNSSPSRRKISIKSPCLKKSWSSVIACKILFWILWSKVLNSPKNVIENMSVDVYLKYPHIVAKVFGKSIIKNSCCVISRQNIIKDFNYDPLNS